MANVISRLQQAILSNYDETSRFSLVHCYVSADESRLSADAGQVEIKLSCGNWYPIEAKLRDFGVQNLLLVWAIFDCHRIYAVNLK